jgi:hypothetical protein
MLTKTMEVRYPYFIRFPAMQQFAAGEVFAMAASFEIAFAVAPKEQKGITSGLNLFLTIGIADFICVAICQLFEFLFPKESTSLDPAEIYATSEIWFPKENDTSLESNRTEEYDNSEMGLFFLLLLGIQLFGTIINVIPTVSNWVEGVRREASKAEAEASAAMIEPESVSTINANVIGSSSSNEESAAGEGDHSQGTEESLPPKDHYGGTETIDF